jgi:hypothetical protein
MNATVDQIRAAAENDLEVFIRLVSPDQVLGQCHADLLSWWTRQDSKTHQLVLFPRDHQKSRMVAYRVAWSLTKDPTLRVLYISATANLAVTGMHCDIAVLDDVVVYENAYTNEGRNKVKSQYSLLSSIEGAEAREWVVGTRYHPADLYNDLMSMSEDIYDKEFNKIAEEGIYEVFERSVEENGDGTGEFLWPRQQRRDGKWFGFDAKILAKKRGQYLDKGQFRAQYYNDPSDPDNVPVSSDKFQYYDRKFLKLENGYWFYKDSRLNVFAAVDFAFSLSKRSDSTAIVVIGIDSENNVYVLDIDRFKTDRIVEYFEHILTLSNKWSFRKMRAEVSVAQIAIVKQLKELIKQHGLSISIEEYRPNKYQGNKQERIASILEPRYDNMQIWHYRGGNIQILEEELSTRNPAHDDVIDALASVVDMAIAPSKNVHRQRKSNVVWSTHKFRGVA